MIEPSVKMNLKVLQALAHRPRSLDELLAIFQAGFKPEEGSAVLVSLDALCEAGVVSGPDERGRYCAVVKPSEEDLVSAIRLELEKLHLQELLDLLVDLRVKRNL